MPERNVLKFNQISFSLFDDLLFLLFTKIKSAETEDQDFLLQNIYNLLMKPFEKDLFDELVLLNEQSKPQKQFVKPFLFIVYDESMFKLPFHLLKLTPATDFLPQSNNGSNSPTKLTNSNTKYLFELFEVSCSFSIKYLMVQPYSASAALQTPSMKVISNERDMDQLESSNHFYELLVLLVNSEHNDVSSMNTLVNTLLNKRLCNVILLEFNYTAKSNNARQELVDSESRAKSFFAKLQSKLSSVNRNGSSHSMLKPSLILDTLINEQNRSQQQMLNYLLFGNVVPIEAKKSGDYAFNAAVVSDDSSNNRKHQQTVRLEPIPDDEEETDTEMDSAIKELDQNWTESGEVTFNQIIVQLLKLNLKFEATPTILKIVLNVVINLI